MLAVVWSLFEMTEARNVGLFSHLNWQIDENICVLFGANVNVYLTVLIVLTLVPSFKCCLNQM